MPWQCSFKNVCFFAPIMPKITLAQSAKAYSNHDSRLTTRKKNALKGKSNRFFFYRINPFTDRLSENLALFFFLFFLAFWLCKIFFFQLQPFARIFFNLLSTIFACAWRICSGPLCDDFPSLGGTVQRKHSKALTLMPAPRPLRDSLQLNASSDTVLHTAAVRAVGCLAFRQHGQPISPVLSVRGCVHRMLVRYRTSVSRILSSHLMWRSLRRQLKPGKLLSSL